MRTGWRILHLLTRTRPRPRRTRGDCGSGESTIDATLAHAWGVKARGVDLIRAALILCADHELNVSSFTARCVASAGSHPYAVVIAGLAALEGTKHGGASARVEAMLASMRRTRDPRGAVAARLRRGETIDGFGHPLYPGGDPRADRADRHDARALRALRRARVRHWISRTRRPRRCGRRRISISRWRPCHACCACRRARRSRCSRWDGPSAGSATPSSSTRRGS